MTFVPVRMNRSAQSSRLFGVEKSRFIALAMSSVAALTKWLTMPGLAPWVITAVGPLPPQGVAIARIRSWLS